MPLGIPTGHAVHAVPRSTTAIAPVNGQCLVALLRERAAGRFCPFKPRWSRPRAGAAGGMLMVLQLLCCGAGAVSAPVPMNLLYILVDVRPSVDASRAACKQALR
eukprot:COSAG02_NODE_7698_length_2887_cov_4.119082_1_plen_105_part_00